MLLTYPGTTLAQLCDDVVIELFYTWLKMRDRAQQGHLLFICFSTVASNLQVGGRGGELRLGRVTC